MRRGLFIGIEGTGPTLLSGCHADARRIAASLAYHENRSRNFETDFLTDESVPISTQNIREVLRDFISKNLESAFIYFSGHAKQSQWGTFFLSDRSDEGISFAEIIDYIHLSDIPEFTLLFDCCFSGSVANLSYAKGEISILRRGVTIFSSSSPLEHSVQGNGRGVYTEAFLSALNGGAADVMGRITTASVQAYIAQFSSGWGQSPFFKSHCDSDSVLRTVIPKIHPVELRKISSIFSKGSTLMLNPAYEPTVLPSDPEKEGIFHLLQKYRDASLVVPFGASSLYDAAMKSRRCELTSLGKFYRELVRKNSALDYR